MPKQVFQASDGTVFTTFEAANEYEVAQEMEAFENLGLDIYLQEVAEENEGNDHVYHDTRLQLSNLLGWCSRNDLMLQLVKKGSHQEKPALKSEINPDALTGEERGFPDISVPPGIDRNKPVPYEPPPAEPLAGRN